MQSSSITLSTRLTLAVINEQRAIKAFEKLVQIKTDLEKENKGNMFYLEHAISHTREVWDHFHGQVEVIKQQLESEAERNNEASAT